MKTPLWHLILIAPSGLNLFVSILLQICNEHFHHFIIIAAAGGNLFWHNTHSAFTRRRLDDTHLLRTIFEKSDVECIWRAKTLKLHLTRMSWWKDPRKKHEVTIAIAIARCNKLQLSQNCSLLDRLRQQYSENRKTEKQMLDVPVLGLAGCHVTGNWNCQSDLASYVHDIHANTGEWSAHPSPIIP